MEEEIAKTEKNIEAISKEISILLELAGPNGDGISDFQKETLNDLRKQRQDLRKMELLLLERSLPVVSDSGNNIFTF
jgi:hypothetical protein